MNASAHRWLFVYLVLLSGFQISCTRRPSPKIFSEQEAPGSDNPAAAAAYEFNMLKDPVTGKIPPGIREAELRQARAIYQKQMKEGENSSNVYVGQGPNN